MGVHHLFCPAVSCAEAAIMPSAPISAPGYNLFRFQNHHIIHLINAAAIFAPMLSGRISHNDYDPADLYIFSAFNGIFHLKFSLCIAKKSRTISIIFRTAGRNGGGAFLLLLQNPAVKRRLLPMRFRSLSFNKFLEAHVKGKLFNLL